MKNNFLQRAITGILFVAIIVGCILYDPLAFGTLFVIVSALTIREFGHLVNQSGEVSINRTITMLGGAYLFLKPLWVSVSTLPVLKYLFLT